MQVYEIHKLRTTENEYNFLKTRIHNFMCLKNTYDVIMSLYSIYNRYF